MTNDTFNNQARREFFCIFRLLIKHYYYFFEVLLLNKLCINMCTLMGSMHFGVKQMQYATAALFLSLIS